MAERATIVVVGNPKGGSGKTTTTFQLGIRLAHAGYRVAFLDVDGRQRSLSRSMENRMAFARERGMNLPMPAVRAVPPSGTDEVLERSLIAALQELRSDHDIILVDCPGADTRVSRMAHACADTLVTPVNESFVDLDLIAEVDGNSLKASRPSWYSEWVWKLRKSRFARDGHRIDWLVVPSRLAGRETRNRKQLHDVLKSLEGIMGFQTVVGLADRVVFRELFPKGLGLADLKLRGLGIAVSMAHVAAHQDLRRLQAALKLKPITERVTRLVVPEPLVQAS